MQFTRLLLVFLSTFASMPLNVVAFNLGNGCHWWLFAVICKGPAQQAAPAPVIVPPPLVSCATCSAPPCPAACQPGLTPAQLAAGQSQCPAPGYPLYASNGNTQCCGPAYDLTQGQLC